MKAFTRTDKTELAALSAGHYTAAAVRESLPHWEAACVSSAMDDGLDEAAAKSAAPHMVKLLMKIRRHNMGR